MNMKINKKAFIKAKIHAYITPGEALKMLREQQGLTQADLSKITGISQSNISALESNSRQIGRERAIIFAKALKVHPAVILFPDFDISKVA
jgi:transcriptional regulator with XRE-family HTH domain